MVRNLPAHNSGYVALGLTVSDAPFLQTTLQDVVARTHDATLQRAKPYGNRYVTEEKPK